VLEGLHLGMATNTTCEASVWNNLFLLSAILKVVDGSIELLSLDGSCYVVGVLEVNAEIRNFALSGFRGFGRLS